MNKKHVYTAGLLLATLVMTTPNVFADGYEGKCMADGKDGNKGSFFREANFVLASKETLGLSDSQMKTIQNLNLDVKKDLIRQHAEAQVLDLDIRSRLYGGDADATAIKQLIDKKYDIEKAEAKALVDAHFKLKDTLDQKQYETLRGLKKDRIKQFSKAGKEHKHGFSEESPDGKE